MTHGNVKLTTAIIEKHTNSSRIWTLAPCERLTSQGHLNSKDAFPYSGHCHRESQIQGPTREHCLFGLFARSGGLSKGNGERQYCNEPDYMSGRSFW